MDRSGTKLSHQEVAEQVLQIYMKSLQDYKSLKSILSEFCILDYFGKFFYEQDKVASHLISNFHGSSYELSSLTVNDPVNFFEWESIQKTKEKREEDLGVKLVSSPKVVFPSLSFSTPVRNCLQPRKRTASEVSLPSPEESKFQKTEESGEQSSSKKKTGVDAMLQNFPLSPETLRPLLPDDIRYVTAYGTIRYSKRVFPNMDPKRIKHRSLVRLRDRFCQLSIGFECDEHVVGVKNCKIWTIKYSVSSRVTPRNLLKSFNEVEANSF